MDLGNARHLFAWAFQRPSHQPVPVRLASPGTSSLRCLCAAMGPGQAEAQADELPMHLLAGALAQG
jgi:hypothetical protein